MPRNLVNVMNAISKHIYFDMNNILERFTLKLDFDSSIFCTSSDNIQQALIRLKEV